MPRRSAGLFRPDTRYQLHAARRANPLFFGPPPPPPVIQEAASPAAVTGTGSTATTASFTPTANSLLVAVSNVGNTSGSGTNTAAVTDSLGSTWTLERRSNGVNGSSEIWTLDAGASPAARTVTVTGAGTTATGVALTVKVLTGAAAAAQQTGATNAVTSGTARNISITTTTADSLPVGGYVDVVAAGALTVDANTTAWQTVTDATNTEKYAAFRATNPTATPGAITIGFSTAAGGNGPKVAVEILPAPVGGTDATATGSTVAGTAAVGSPAVQLGAAIGGTTVAGVAAIGAATVTTSTTAAAATVAAATTISAVAKAGATVTGATVAAAAAITTPTVRLGVTAAATTVAGVAAIGAPTLPDLAPPTVPANVRITGSTPTSLDVAWDASSDNVGVTQYEVRLLAGPPTDPRGALWARTDLRKGAQIGAWDTGGGLLTGNATARSLVQAAGTTLVRWQMWRTPTDLGGSQTTAEFLAGLDTARKLATGNNAVLLLGLPPIWNEQYPGQPDPWTYAWQQFMVEKTIGFLGAAAATDVIFEMGNEPDNYGPLTAQQYYDTLWKPNVPALKAWARATFGVDIRVGGPAWANSYAANLADIQTWLTDCKNDYGTYGRDIIPDFVSTHTYLVTPTENANTSVAQARINQWGQFYKDVRAAVDSTFTGMTDRGYPIARQVKVVDSEYNATIQNTSTVNDSQVWTDYYMGAMHEMFRRSGVWAAVEFTIASHTGGALDLLDNTGAAKPLYTSFAAQ